VEKGCKKNAKQQGGVTENGSGKRTSGKQRKGQNEESERILAFLPPSLPAKINKKKTGREKEKKERR
jgi:hypothetical protein